MQTRLYVGNLPDDVSIEALRQRFAQCGVVSDVHLAMDRASGRARGYAFVTMATASDARLAKEKLNGALFEHNALRVNDAGEERDGARSSASDRRRAQITFQFRERHNMTYELDCNGVALSIKTFPSENEDSWRVEALVKHVPGLVDAVDVVLKASAPTRAAALQEIARSWPEEAASRSRPLDWSAIADVLAAVRAI